MSDLRTLLAAVERHSDCVSFDDALVVFADWLREDIARLEEERQQDRARPDGGDRVFRMDAAMQMLAITRLADTLAPALTDTQETDR